MTRSDRSAAKFGPVTDTNSPSAVPGGEHTPGVAPVSASHEEPVDLDGIERDLDDVQAALDRLNDGTYWTDEVTGESIPDDVLEADPTARTTASGTVAGG